MLEILERDHGVLKILLDSLPHVASHAVPHDQESHGGETGGDQHHGQQKTGTQPCSGRECASGLFWESLQDGF
jgi:hypothetical protein